MRSTLAFFCFTVLTLLAACGTEPTIPVQPAERPFLDGGGYMGTGNRTATDSVTTRGGTGYMGSGN